MLRLEPFLLGQLAFAPEACCDDSEPGASEEKREDPHECEEPPPHLAIEKRLLWVVGVDEAAEGLAVRVEARQLCVSILVKGADIVRATAQADAVTRVDLPSPFVFVEGGYLVGRRIAALMDLEVRLQDVSRSRDPIAGFVPGRQAADSQGADEEPSQRERQGEQDEATQASAGLCQFHGCRLSEIGETVYEGVREDDVLSFTASLRSNIDPVECVHLRLSLYVA